MKMKIKTQLLITCISLTLSIVIAQMIFNLFFLTDYYVDYKSDGILEAFSHIKDSYDGTVDSFETSSQEFEDRHNLQILIFSSERILYITQNEYLQRKPSDHIINNGADINRLLFQDHQFKINIKNENNDPIEERVNSLFSSNPQIDYFGRMDDERKVLRLMGKFEDDYNEFDEIFVSITLPMESIEDSVTVFIHTSSIISLAVLVISVFASIVIGKSLTKPIKQIEETAFNLSNLDFSNQLSEDINTLELASLSKSINNMSNQLKSVINELNYANEKLQEDVDNQKKLEKMRREFVANVSHEMKTPLTLLQMYSENLKNNIDNVDKEYYCDTIIEETEYLHKMVKSMLNISAIESGIYKLEYNKFSITNLVLQLVDRMELLMADVILELNIGEDIFIEGDENYLEQAMKNYITNAISHTTKQGILRISLSESNESFLYSVYNQGQLIDDEDIEHLWESFYKSDKARVRTVEGNSGLGLHLVQSIVEKHNGKCWVENKADGVIFSMELPKYKNIDC